MASYMIEKEKLEGEYKEAFERVEAYAMLRGVDSETQEDRLMNLVDLLLTAQVEQKPVEKIVGKNIRHFCKDYFGDYSALEHVVLDFPNWLYTMSWILFIFCVLEAVFPENEENFHIISATIEIQGYLFGIVTGIILSLILGSVGQVILFRLKKVNVTVISVIVIFVGVSAVIGGCIWMGERTISVPLLPTMIISGGYVAVYKGIQLALRYRKYGTFKKPVKDGSVKEIFKESYQESMQKDLPKELKKRFLKMNGKRRKRGKPELTPEEYMELLHKENKKVLFQNKILLVMYVLIWGFFVVIIATDSTVEDTLLFAVILGFIFFPLYLLLSHCAKKLAAGRKYLLEQCEEEGITVIELAERIEMDGIEQTNRIETDSIETDGIGKMNRNETDRIETDRISQEREN